MSWRERLLPASFRGVTFEVEASSDRFGRRGQTNQYPGRDVPFREDLGRSARQYSLEAFLIGDDYMELRDRLLTALEEGGSGTLVHPWFGSLQVDVDGECNVNHRWDDGGYCIISMSFVESGEQRYPTRGRDTAQALLTQADALESAAAASFADAYEVAGWPDFVAEGSVASVTTLLGRLGENLAAVGQVLEAPLTFIQGQVGEWLGPQSQLEQFTSAVSSLWGQLNDFADKPLQLQSQIRSLLSFSQDALLRPLGLWQNQSDSARQVTGNQNAVSAYLRQSAIAEALRLTATIPSTPPIKVVSRPAVDATVNAAPVLVVGNAELLALRDELGAVLDREGIRSNDDSLFLRLEEVRLAAHADLGDRASQAPRLVTLTPTEVLPAVVLAARWQDDASRADELVARNGIKHPGFVPVKPLKVLST